MSDNRKLYEVDDVREILGVSRTNAYELIKKAYIEQRPFKVIKVGKLYRIPAKSFDKWIDGED